MPVARLPNRGNRLALATFNRVPRPINPSAPTDAGDGFLMRHGYTVVWCGWQHDVPAVDGLMRIEVPEGRKGVDPVSGKLLVSFQPSAPAGRRSGGPRRRPCLPRSRVRAG